MSGQTPPTGGGRYLVITEMFLPTKGGTAVWFDAVYRRIGDKDTHIVTAAVPGDTAHDARHPNTIHRLRLRRHGWLRPESLAMYAKLFAVAAGLALAHRFTAVHAGRVLPEGLTAWLVARMVRRPAVIYAHGEEITTWRTPGKRRAMRFTFRHADRVVANSEFTREQLLRLGISPASIAVIHPGVDIDHFHPGLETADLRVSIALQPGQHLILSVGRLSRRKGFDQVIRSLPILLQQKMDVQYAIIGTGEDRDYLGSLAHQVGVAERVHLLGQVSPEDLPRWYNACAVLAMPNREIDGDTEGFGMVFLEAAACARPVVAGRAGGAGSAVLHGVTGLSVDGADLQEVASALARILSDPALRDALGRKGRARALRDFSWEAVARKTIAMTRGL